MRISLLLALFVAACSFNERDFGDRLCTGDLDCPRPDQACIQNTCTQKSCANELACGSGFDFDCAAGLCVVRTCGTCEPGYACNDGFCQSSFNVTTVASVSNTSIAITFDSAPDATTATTLASYTIDGLTVSGTPSLSGSTVTLTTTPQASTSYNVTVTGVTRDFDKAPLIVATGAFAGRSAFGVLTAASTSAINVMITFSEPPDPVAAANLANYSIATLGLDTTKAPMIAGSTVTLTTAPQSQTAYTVTVSNVRRAGDLEALTTTTAPFTGRNDFNISSATPKTSTTLEITYDALPNAVKATTLANYTINPPLALSGQPTITAGGVVTLATAPQEAISYTVTVANVSRASDGELLNINAKTFEGRTPFNVIDAASVTSTSMVVTFDGPPDPTEAMTLANYSIPSLTLSGTPQVSGNMVTLTTSPQSPVSYAVNVNNVHRTDGEALTDKVATFLGRAPFNVTLATATSSTSVAVTFDDVPNAGQAVIATNYSIPGLTVLGATLAGSIVTLTTSPQAAQTYTVTVSNITRGTDGELLTNAAANFVGRAPFNLTQVTTPTSTSIAVTFDAAPNVAQATTLANYSVPGLTLTGTPSLVNKTVTITTAPQLAQTYTLTVSNVRRAVDAEPLTVTSYDFAGRPRFNVLSAASTSNVSMTVTFDAPPDETQAETLANYNVPGLTLSGAPVLVGNTVTVTTSTQTGGQSYTVTVANVTRTPDAEPLFTASASFTGRVGFNVTSATSINTTAIAVTFDALPNAAQAQTLANYSVPGLTLSGTPTLNMATNTVTLTTSPQAGGSYTVSVANVTRNSDGSPLVINSATFTYVSFNVASAVSLTNRSIAVTFDAPPTAAQATTLANYAVPGLVLSGTPVLAGNTVTITTSTQSAISYTVTVTNVTRASDGSSLANKTATFTGRTAFNVIAAAAPTSGSITVTFSHAPDPVAATTLAYYSVPGLTLSGTPQLAGNTVTITTSVQSAITYNVTVMQVTRASDAEPLGTTMATFTGKPLSIPTVANVVVQTTVPDNGPKFYNTGTATVVITGTEFTGVMCPAGVTLDDKNGVGTVINTPAMACTVNSGTQITATFPAGIRTNGPTGWNVRVTNAVGTNATSAVKLVPFAGVLVSEVMIGLNGGGNDKREFIELYNPTNNSINVNNLGLVVHLRNGAGTDTPLALTVVAGRRTIPTHGFMMLVSTASTADSWYSHRDMTYDANQTAGDLVTNGSVYLSLSTNAQVKVIDKLGWGSQGIDGREGTAASSLGNDGKSTQRKPAGGGGAATDTDANSADFNAPTATITPKGTNDLAEP